MEDSIKSLESQCEDNSARIDSVGSDLSALYVKIEELEKNLNLLRKENKKIKNAEVIMKLKIDN